MKRSISLAVATVFGFVLVIGAGSAFASLAVPIRVNIPFEFNVGGTTLPAGEYVISSPSETASHLLAIRSLDGASAVFIQAEPLSPKHDIWEPDTRLTFEKVNGKEFLMKVWEFGSEMGYVLPASEKAVRTLQMAKAGGN
jgi:hypothetical protein